MPFTMVATDFDDTLVPIGALLSERNRAALDRVRAKGITTVIASGRTSHGLFTQLDRNQVDTQGLYLIGYNGALACQAWDAKPLFSHQLDIELVRRAAQVASNFDVALMIPEGAHVFTNQPDHFAVVFEAESNDVDIVRLDSLAELPVVPHKMLIGGEPDELVRAHRELRARLGEEAEVVMSASFLMEFTAKGVHKGEALVGLCRTLDVPLEQVVVIGDNHNDAQMFGVGGYSVAVANAVPELIALADRVTGASADDGVAAALDELFA